MYLVKRGQYDGNKSINAFLSYQTEDQCRAAIEILNGSYLNGLAKYPLEVDFAVPRKTGRRYYAQPPEQLEHTAEFAEGNWQQHHQQSQDDEQNQMDNQEPDLRQPQTPPKASEKTPPMAPAMPPMHHLPPRLPLPPVPPVPPFAPPRYPLMVPHGYPVPPQCCQWDTCSHHHLLFGCRHHGPSPKTGVEVRKAKQWEARSLKLNLKVL